MQGTGPLRRLLRHGPLTPSVVRSHSTLAACSPTARGQPLACPQPKAPLHWSLLQGTQPLYVPLPAHSGGARGLASSAQDGPGPAKGTASGAWSCLQCSAENLPAASYVCFHCNSLRGGKLPYMVADGHNWVCKCGQANRLGKCKACHSERALTEVLVVDQAQYMTAEECGLEPSHSASIGLWRCSCNRTNGLLRKKCLECSKPRPYHLGFPRGGGFTKGDWSCARCNTINFGSSTSCFGCANKNSQDFKPKGWNAVKEADWACGGCQRLNPPEALFCSGEGCLSLRDTELPQFGPGDWLCRCGSRNANHSHSCHRCLAKRTATEIPLRKDQATGRAHDPAIVAPPAHIPKKAWLCAQTGCGNFNLGHTCTRCGSGKPLTPSQLTLDMMARFRRSTSKPTTEPTTTTTTAQPQSAGPTSIAQFLKQEKLSSLLGATEPFGTVQGLAVAFEGDTPKEIQAELVGASRADAALLRLALDRFKKTFAGEDAKDASPQAAPPPPSRAPQLSPARKQEVLSILTSAKATHDKGVQVRHARLQDWKSASWKCDACQTINTAGSHMCDGCSKQRGVNSLFCLTEGVWLCGSCMHTNEGDPKAGCDKCGKTSRNLDESELDWICSTHGHANHASREWCSKCPGTKAEGFHHLRSIVPGSRTWECGSCGFARNPLTLSTCHKCKESPTSINAAATLTARTQDIVCPTCSRSNPSFRDTCASCEAVLQ